MLNGDGALGVLRLLLALLLHNTLLSHAFVFFVDGNAFYSAVVRYFSWYSNLSVILDWYHLVRQEVARVIVWHGPYCDQTRCPNTSTLGGEAGR